jgi:predicted phosphodiesterase
MIEIKKADGLLFVGDPHLWTFTPDKRLDNFSETVLKKLEEIVEIANANNLIIVILGDLFHKHEENNISLLTKLTRIFKKAKYTPITAEGNHEKSQTKLSDDVATSLLRESETIYTMEKNGLWGKFHFSDGSKCFLGSTPYGEKIPKEITSPELNTPVIWLTHHNLDFGDSYPGVVPIHEIKGVSMLVNGHIHQTKIPRKLGNMIAYNPGNISRLSKDCKDHVPAVWQWKPSQGWELEPITLTYQKIIFKAEIELEEKVELVVPDEVTPQQKYQFIEKMNEFFKTQDQNKTDEGVEVKEHINTLGKVMNLENDFMTEILQIADETITIMRQDSHK